MIKIGIPSKGRLRKDTLNIFKNKKLKILSEREPWLVPILIAVPYSLQIRTRGVNFTFIRSNSALYVSSEYSISSNYIYVFTYNALIEFLLM